MKNYEILLIRNKGEAIADWTVQRDSYPNVDKVYASPHENCIDTANLIYPQNTLHELHPLHPLHIIDNLREYDFTESVGDTPVFTLRCVEGLQEVFADMSFSGIYSAAVITHIGVIVTLLAGCGLPAGSPEDFAPQPGEGWLIRVSPYLWQKGNAFEIVGKLTYE